MRQSRAGKACVAALAFLTLTARPARAQEVDYYAWDGTADDGLGWMPSVTVGEYVQRFDPGSGGGVLNGIGVCLSGIAASVSGTAVVYAADGPAGEPGTLLARSPATTIPVSAFPLFTCTTVPVPPVGLDQPVFGGLEWAPNLEPGIFIGVDTSPATPLQDMRDRSGTAMGIGAWAPVSTFQPDARALGIGFVTEGAQIPCRPDATTLCLSGGRFQVAATWRRQNGSTGPGMAAPLTSESGYFWFFKPANIELVTKVLRACAEPNPRYWVFAAGLTNVEVTITVRDTQSGQVRKYENPLGTPFQPIQDTSAFATCP